MAKNFKSSESATAAMQQMLQERCIADPSFAVKMANPQKSIEGAINYLCSQVKKSGLCCLDDTSVMNILVHYYDETDIKDCAEVGCEIVVSKPVLSEEDKAELKWQAMEQYRNEQIIALRSASQAKARRNSTNPAKSETSNDSQLSLFDL